jgi:prephenate dehydratase
MPDVPPARYAYLGPEGTFAEAALRSVSAAHRAEAHPHDTVLSALDAVRRGEVDGAMVPLENSVEGGVAVTLDELATGDPLMIIREVLLPVTFAMLARPGRDLDAVKQVITHPHAEAQCRRWLAANVPAARVHPASSTALAAMLVAEDTAYDAAIAGPIAAEHYRLNVIAHDIGDARDAVTRFVLVSRPGPPAPPTGSDRTSVVAFIRDDHPGALLEILTEFAVRGVNLTRIESRPTGEGMGRYCFSIDCEGHIANARVGEAMMGLRRVCAELRFLGSYARADGERAAVRPGTSDPEFQDAATWLAGIRGQAGS